ncbi:RidA family protein [Kribbella sp. CA-253562]|uniref:RidA family protein n=1 Tax=Kribbella sp. CA-253562 TaxID=3239942 RepID=UPI003D902635
MNARDTATPATAGGPLARRALLSGGAGLMAAGAAAVALPGTAHASHGSSYQVINPSNVPPPLGFSHGVAVEARRTVLLAGQVGQHPDGSWAVGAVAQYEQALRYLLSVVRAAGGRPKNLVSLTIFVTDLPQFQAHYDEIQAVWRRLVGPDYPAQAVIAVSALWFPEALMELQGIAALFE